MQKNTSKTTQNEAPTNACYHCGDEVLTKYRGRYLYLDRATKKPIHPRCLGAYYQTRRGEPVCNDPSMVLYKRTLRGRPCQYKGRYERAWDRAANGNFVAVDYLEVEYLDERQPRIEWVEGHDWRANALDDNGVNLLAKMRQYYDFCRTHGYTPNRRERIRRSYRKSKLYDWTKRKPKF